jgi:hypothetical protein
VSYTYNTFLSAFALNLVIQPTDPNFLSMLPNAIDDGEQRIRRDLDLLANVVRDQTGNLTANSRNFTFPQHFVVSESINVFTPAGTTTNRNQLVPVSREWLDAVWGNETAPATPSVPQYYAMITDQQIIVGPAPDTNYKMEVVGTTIPLALSATNTTTWISLNLPDLFMSACMIYGSAWQLNFSAMGDNPAQAVSWESHYSAELQSANTEEQRKRYASQAWSPKQIYSTTTPPRV